MCGQLLLWSNSYCFCLPVCAAGLIHIHHSLTRIKYAAIVCVGRVKFEYELQGIQLEIVAIIQQT